MPDTSGECRTVCCTDCDVNVVVNVVVNVGMHVRGRRCLPHMGARTRIVMEGFGGVGCSVVVQQQAALLPSHLISVCMSIG
jgi:hypothetical protein